MKGPYSLSVLKIGLHNLAEVQSTGQEMFLESLCYFCL